MKWRNVNNAAQLGIGESSFREDYATRNVLKDPMLYFALVVSFLALAMWIQGFAGIAAI